jgi:hypothetical protein
VIGATDCNLVMRRTMPRRCLRVPELLLPEKS